ncbi:hybrid sensor histidine kinase/response regulator transcription factor [Hymenobacter seoulensis]
MLVRFVFLLSLIRAGLLLIILLLLLPAAYAQQTPPADFRFEHLTVDQGLSHSDAMAVAQDPAGFIWVATNRGLDRYDGYSLKQYWLPVNQQNGISANRIKVLHAAPDGRLWVGTERTGLSVYNAAADRLLTYNEAQVPARFQAQLRRLSQESVVAIASDRQGRLWVGTAHQDLFVFTFDARGQLLSLGEVQFPAGRGPETLQISSLACDAEGQIWVGTNTLGLCVIRPGGNKLLAETTTLTKPVRALHLDARGDLWVGTIQQVYWISAAHRRQARELTAHQLPQSYEQVQSLLLDSFGRLWVGTIHGLYVWESNRATAVAPPLRSGPPTRLLPEDGEPYSINSERVHQIFEDRNQVVWLCASAGGLNKVNLRQKPFGRLRRQLMGQATLPNNYVNAIYKEEGRNILWSGTRNGVSAYDLARARYLDLPWAGPIRGEDVATIFQSSNGTLWFGTRESGLKKLVRQGGREQLTSYTKLPNGQNLLSTSVESMAEDRFGTLWVATFTQGLVRLRQDGTFLSAYGTAGRALPTNNFTYLLYDRNQDVLWASTTDEGLLKLRVTPDSVQLLRHFKHTPGASSGLAVNYVWPLLLDRQGALWIGTIGGGLHQLQTDAQGREVIRSYRRWLPEIDVESIQADDDGHLWIGGTGLYRFATGTRQYLRYDVGDGLQSNAFKIGASARAQDGTLYFGGINGISYFQPRSIVPNPYPPVVQITGLRIANHPVRVGEELNGRVVLAQPLSQPQTVTIGASEKDFSVEFVGLNYANPQKNRYAYRLVGYNRDWVHPAPGQRTASFANLPAGQYTFEVKASNGEGAWSPQPATIRFEVQAPWYKTWWAYTLYAALAGGLMLLYRRVEIAQQELRNKVALERFQKEKEQEVTALKLGFFTNVSHELRTPLTLILGPMEDIMESPNPAAGLSDKIKLMHRQAQKLLELVNQLLDFRKVETGNVPLRAERADVVPFLRDVYGMFRLKAAERAVDYTLDVPAQPLRLYLDRSKLEIILSNLLANAFKYTRTKGNVQLTASPIGDPTAEAEYSGGRLTGNYLKITVSDTGVGIKPHELEHIFDPYYQASHTDTLRMTGTGIGLSLAQQFAKRHGGSLSVASSVGVGSTFELRLPFGQAHLKPEDIQEAPPQVLEEATPPEEATPELPEPADTAEQAAAQPLLPVAPTGPLRLLVVEDHDEVRDYLRELLAPEYVVLTAADGEEGWEQALSQLPDLIISDVMMPRSDGLELCHRVKQHPKTAHIPVVLLTARTAETHELEGLGMGADDYLSKPFNPTILRAKVDTLLRNRRKLHEFYQRHILLEPTEIVVADADRLFLEGAMAVVERNLDNPEFSVQVLVREMGLSQSVFYRRIKSISGQTAVEFIRDVRIKRAAQLLASTPMRVSEVAFEVGIENVKYFRKAFQGIFNMTPTEYIRQHRQTRPEVTSHD